MALSYELRSSRGSESLKLHRSGARWTIEVHCEPTHFRSIASLLRFEFSSEVVEHALVACLADWNTHRQPCERVVEIDGTAIEFRIGQSGDFMSSADRPVLMFSVGLTNLQAVARIGLDETVVSTFLDDLRDL
jgi:hypothetical protein